jgi:hypothetical protein
MNSYEANWDKRKHCVPEYKESLTWFGHVERMETNRLPHRVLHCYIKGNRSRGRQRKTWLDNVKEDLETKNLMIRTATELVRERSRWKNLVQTHHQYNGWKGEKRGVCRLGRQ